MQRLTGWTIKPTDLLLPDDASSADERMERKAFYSFLFAMREWPDIAMQTVAGVFEPVHQRTMMRVAHRGAGTFVTVSSRGTSKCLAAGTPIIMADGSRRAVEHVQVGDHVMGPDSAPKRVLYTTSGVGPLYRVRQTSAQDYVVNDAHVLALKKSRTACERVNGTFGQWVDEYANVNVQEFAQYSRYVRENLRGYKVPLRFAEQPVPLDPYFFGIWLGDGTANYKVVSITTADQEVRDACEVLASNFGVWTRVNQKANNRAQTISLVCNGTRSRKNPVLEVIRGLKVMSGPGEKSKHKHIPQVYLANSETVRLELLAGLIDSDGCKDHNGYTFTNTNERLARDTKYLADTLGFRTSIYEIPTKCQNFEGSAWRLSINGDVWRIPCRVARKRYDAAEFRKNKDWRVSQVSVEPIGDGQWYGFECEGHLFLLGDCTVTHNSSTMGVQYPVYRLSFWTRIKGILLSASGFRGGQGLFNDLSRMVRGGWDSQKAGLEFLKAASVNPKVIHRAANFWEWGLSNFSAYKTLPTKDPDGIRGERANMLFVDESNFVREDLIDRVAKPFLNVKTDFEHGGAYAQSNNVFYMTTVDYAWRPFGRIQEAAIGELTADYEAVEAYRRGDKRRYVERAKEGFAKQAYVCFDYSDTFVRERGVTRDGRRYQIKWPNAKLPLVDRPGGLPFTERGRSGAMKQRGSPTRGWSTYPIDFDAVEGGLYDGSTPIESWLSEQKNVRDTAQGDVFPSNVLDDICFVGDRNLIGYDDCPKAWQDAYSDDMRDYAPQVLYRCTDPCVVGMDYAGGDRDFCAFVVIRIGPMATGTYDPMTGHGKTPWSNVIWAEQHRLMSHEDAAQKIWQFAERYNLAYYDMPGLDDDWRVCRAIGLDMRGGGVGVRDQLVHINTQDLKPNEYRIYDPLDTDSRVQAFARDPKAKPMLDAISPTDTLNDRLVEFCGGQMQKKLIYLAKFLPDALRSGDERADVSMAYNAIKTLEHQLRKIQQEPTKNARRFYMAGDTERTEKKKDLFSAFIYAMKQVRAHTIRLRMIDTVRAEAAAERVVMTQGNPKLRGIGGKSPGSKM